MFKKKRDVKLEAPIEVVSMAELRRDLGLEETERPVPVILETRNDAFTHRNEPVAESLTEPESTGVSAFEMAMKDAYEATAIVRSGSPVE